MDNNEVKELRRQYEQIYDSLFKLKTPSSHRSYKAQSKQKVLDNLMRYVGKLLTDIRLKEE